MLGDAQRQFGPDGPGIRCASRKGEPLTLREWSQLFEYGDPAYGPDRRDLIQVRLTQVGDHVVSTVWWGLEQAPFMGPDLPPLIFETLVQSPDPDLDGKSDRYFTEEQALKGHDEMVASLTAVVPDDVIPVQIHPPSQTPTEE